jgi:hypothetical protein
MSEEEECRGVLDRSFGALNRKNLEIVRNSDLEGFAGIQNRSFGTRTNQNLEVYVIGLSEHLQGRIWRPTISVVRSSGKNFEA